MNERIRGLRIHTYRAFKVNALSVIACSFYPPHRNKSFFCVLSVQCAVCTVEDCSVVLFFVCVFVGLFREICV